MALFNKKKKEEKKEALVPAVSEKGGGDFSELIIRPRVTEKSAHLGESKVFTFDVSARATKSGVKKAIQALYRVTPLDVRFAIIPAKKVFIRGRVGYKNGGKKAYVHLKKEDTIEIA